MYHHFLNYLFEFDVLTNCEHIRNNSQHTLQVHRYPTTTALQPHHPTTRCYIKHHKIDLNAFHVECPFVQYCLLTDFYHLANNWYTYISDMITQHMY